MFTAVVFVVSICSLFQNLLQKKVVAFQIPEETPSHFEFHFPYSELGRNISKQVSTSVLGVVFKRTGRHKLLYETAQPFISKFSRMYQI